MIEIVTLCLVAVIAIQVWDRSRLQGLHSKEMLDMAQRYTEEQSSWSKERQQLLDRIQSSSFAEYKTAEIKVIKAQSGEKEPPKLEQL